jgi:hypothetical protein
MALCGALFSGWINGPHERQRADAPRAAAVWLDVPVLDEPRDRAPHLALAHVELGGDTPHFHVARFLEIEARGSEVHVHAPGGEAAADVAGELVVGWIAQGVGSGE